MSQLPSPLPLMDIPQEQLDLCVDVLQKLADHPVDAETEEALQGLHPLITKLHHKLRRAKRKREKKRDRHLRTSTERVQQHLQDQTFLNPSTQTRLRASEAHPMDREGHQTAHASNHCYSCKQSYREIHPFYHLLCPTCADLNQQKRHARVNLAGRTALMTGGRIKIGYQTALRMLRDGARVIVTTRFPRDCARRYSLEDDFEEWRDRLQIYGLDLRHIPALEEFIQYLLHTESSLDILINNAAQTIKRPRSFYQHLLEQEQQPLSALPKAVQSLLRQCPAPQLPKSSAGLRIADGMNIKPLDRDGQPLDLRSVNSWVLKLEQVGTLELLEVQVVNAIAPFILNSKLKPLLMASPFDRRFIINVSAMEGQFNRDSKTADHPHTNMAKAALNMMTRTSAQDYANDNIFMNSVDTGWITNENPYPKAMHMQAQQDFYPPLDVIDGMARIYDPIVQGILNVELPLYGYFLKDYLPYPW